MRFRHEKLRLGLDLTRFNKIAIQGTPQMAVDKQCSAQVFKRAGCHLKRAHLAR